MMESRQVLFCGFREFLGLRAEGILYIYISDMQQKKVPNVIFQSL